MIAIENDFELCYGTSRNGWPGLGTGAISNTISNPLSNFHEPTTGKPLPLSSMTFCVKNKVFTPSYATGKWMCRLFNVHVYKWISAAHSKKALQLYDESKQSSFKTSRTGWFSKALNNTASILFELIGGSNRYSGKKINKLRARVLRI